jgi:isoleucyl-tRNA synthetase
VSSNVTTARIFLRLSLIRSAQNRLEAFVTSRSEWCISRQRSWGVPIPALYDQSGTPILDSRTVSHIIRVLEEKGTNHWWTGALEEFIPDHLSGQSLVKGTDTLDVWFDSGSSWTLLEESALRDISTQPLADVYLEGSDQHRGWFQSSLLTRLGVRSDETRAPYGSIISHGMVMDEDGNKMSKSAGNGLSPVEVVSGSKVSEHEIMKLMTKDKIGFGADTLRLWAASVDYTRDVSIGPSALTHASETLRKIRSATRFLLANSSGHSIPQLQEAQLSTVSLVSRV